MVNAGKTAVPSSSSPTVRSHVPLLSDTTRGADAAVSGVSTSRSRSMVSGAPQARVRLGWPSPAAAVQVVSGSPSIAASAFARGSGVTELLAVTDGPQGRAVPAISASRAGPGDGTAWTDIP